MILLLLACTNDETVELSAGDYQFSTHDMDDACLDGALEALFMPEGRTTPHQFEFPIYVPDLDELPGTFEISLREPFVEMPVDVKRLGQTGMSLTGLMEAVELNPSLYGDCVTTMSVSAEMTPLTKNSGEMTALVDISEARSDADDRCPPLDADPCRVTLYIQGDKL
ncbi:MAG: hypothetical protein GY913_35290 [Proteobacteria bacterium]|nr:hypothetical protein [Pseudomonadota bacterium]MCP4922196.1 hypothetical protein [Pseudomonadota bacterium]